MATTKSNPWETLEPLPSDIFHGLSWITGFAFLSLVTTAILFIHLAYRLITWKDHSFARANQYVALLINLIAADLQQAIGFILNIEWVAKNAIEVDTPSCWTQGWFLNAGDVGSCIFTSAMAVHLFADIILDKRLGYSAFIITIVLLWIFNFFLATIGIILHPSDFYMRAGMWCWVNENYMEYRLWIHYIWLLIAEFGVVVIYTIMFIILCRRTRSFFYSTNDLRSRAQSAVKSVIAYPIVYVVCTLPAVVARLKLMAGGKATIPELTAVGVMIVSNGWLDVVLYTITRRSLIFGPTAPVDDVYALETFTRYRPERTDNGSKAISSPARAYSKNAFNKNDSADDLFGDISKSYSLAHTEYSNGREGRRDTISTIGVDGAIGGKHESFSSFDRRFRFNQDGMLSPTETGKAEEKDAVIGIAK